MPKSVKVIGWLLIIASVYSILSSVFSFLFLDALEPKYQMYSYSMRIFLTIYGLLFVATALVSSIQFLRLRNWARRALEALSWLYIIQQVARAIYMLLIHESYFLEIMLDAGLDPSSILKTVFIGLYVFVIGLGIVLALIILKHLGGDTIKNAMIH